jgi:hypothetical protein
VHITVEIPFNSSAFVQQLGRTHRSNQVSGPEYIAVITDLPVRAPIMCVARRFIRLSFCAFVRGPSRDIELD